ncbi:MAG: helix-turn-helix domain-containing protein [Desulfohalobiaceae bacterium]|nr:helix-turn-helix domain-containing protein [Desulfohalobiaceae bacterium]
MSPLRAGLIETAPAYRWSSCSLYCRDGSQESFVDPRPILGLVHDDEPAARREYRQILLKAKGAAPANALEQEGAIEKLCVSLAELFPALFKKLGRKYREDRGQIRSLLELTQLERLLQEADTSQSPKSRQAKKFIIEQLLARGYKKTEIASRLGISRRSVYNIVNSLGE